MRVVEDKAYGTVRMRCSVRVPVELKRKRNDEKEKNEEKRYFLHYGHLAFDSNPDFLFLLQGFILLAFQPCYVGKVLRPADGFLVPDQVLPSNDGELETLYLGLRAIPPGIVEIDAINGRENVDPPRRDADLQDGFGAPEALFAYGGRRRPESHKGPDNPAGVFGRTTYPQVDVARGARQAVYRKRVGAHQQKLNFFFVKP